MLCFFFFSFFLRRWTYSSWCFQISLDWSSGLQLIWTVGCCFFMWN